MDDFYMNKDLTVLYKTTLKKLAHLIRDNIDKSNYSHFYDYCLDLFGEEFTNDAIDMALKMRRLGD